jgi:large exoprotein involved in heme utilization and adhesion
MTMTDGSLIVTASLGSGAAGNISLNAGSLNVINNASVQSLAFADGRGGDIGVNASTVMIKDGGFLSTGTFSSGAAGNINMDVGTLMLDGGQITTGAGDTGPAGNITIAAAGDVSLLSNSGSSLIENFSTGDGAAGNISLQVGSLSVASGSTIDINTQMGDTTGSLQINSSGPITLSGVIGNIGFGPNLTNAGPIEITAPSMMVNNGAIETQISGEGRASDIILQVGNLTVNGGSRIDSTTVGPGRGGDIRVTSDSVSIADSGLFSDAQPGTTGRGGDIQIQAHQVDLSNGATISSKTDGAGDAGNILMKADIFSMNGGSTITASSTGSGNAGSVTIEGTASPAQSLLIDGAGSGIFTDTSGTGAGGNINISSQSVTLQNGGTLSAKTSGTEASATGGTITVDAYQLNADGATITVEATGAGDAGQIALVTQPTGGLTADAINLTNSIITSSTSTNANAGNILLQTGSLHADNTFIASDAFPAEGFTGGNAGTIHAQVNGAIELTNSFISTSTAGNGKAGDILLASDSLQAESSLLASLAMASPGLSGGNGGTIQLNVAHDAVLSNSSIDSQTVANGNAGNIFVNAGSLTLTTSSLSTGTSPFQGFTGGHAGNIDVTVGSLSMTDGLIVSQSSFSAGNAGTVTINASESIATSGTGIFPFAISTSTDGAAPFCPGTCGNGGNITVTAPTIALNAVGLNSTTTGQGNAGNILVKGDTLSITNGAQISASAEGPVVTGTGGTVTVQGLASPAQSVLIDGAGSGLFTDTQGTGAGGNILVNVNSVTLQNGGTLSAATSGTDVSATGGTITVNANQVQLNSGGSITASTTGAGAGGSINIGTGTFTSNAGSVSSTATQATGGDITITAGQSATLTNGSSISASSTGPGNAGNIMINAGQSFTSTNSAVTTQATAPNTNASGGNITVKATDLVWLTNSQLNASVQGSSTTVGGNIVIDPQSVILQNSQILAQATQGNGGNITIFTNLLLEDANSTISASSQFGRNGTITIQSPINPAGGKIIPLSQKPLIATALLSQRCAALAGGQYSSFTMAGRDSLPAEPGSWLSTPLALASEFGGGTFTEGSIRTSMNDSEGDAPLLSLRQIAPPGFLTQAFAVQTSAGCTS